MDALENSTLIELITQALKACTDASFLDFLYKLLLEELSPRA